jgi:hypothetical protein
MRNILIILTAFFILGLRADIEIKAPFGFEWGQTKSDLSSKGIDLVECSVSDSSPVESCRSKNSPKKFSKADFFYLHFSSDEGLQKVSMLGGDITNDAYGTDGKEQYSSLKASLTKKYDKPSSVFEWTGRELYKDADEFYECLKYQGCGNNVSYWLKGVEGTIALELYGVSRGSGFLMLTYESKRWSDILDKFNNEKNSADEDSL